MSTLPLKEAKLRIRKSNGKIYFTVEDLIRFPEYPEGPLVELIDGELFMTPSPNIIHQKISSELHYQIKDYLKNNKLGQVFTAPIDVKLSEEDLTIPDIVFVETGKEKIIEEQLINGSPNLIIEIVSTNKKQDYVVKKDMYEKFQVKEYWIVDPTEKIILVYLLQENKKYGQAFEYKITDKVPVKEIKTLYLQLQL